MRGWLVSSAVLACACVGVAGCAARGGRPTWVAAAGDDDELDVMAIDALVERAPELAPRAVVRRARSPASTSTLVALPAPPVVLPLVRPRAGGDALVLADLALARNDPFDAVAQYRAILAHRPAYAAYVQFQLAKAYIALGEPHRALPHLRAAATAPAPEGWAALTLLAELRAKRVGGVGAVAELRALAGARVVELEAHLVHALDEADRGPLLMAMAIDATATSAMTPSTACELAVTAVAAGYVEDNPQQLDVSCRDDVERALTAATSGEITERTITFEWEFNRAAYAWEDLRERVHAGDLDALPWLDLAEQYLIARAAAVQPRHKNLASLGAQNALTVAVELQSRTGQTDRRIWSRVRLINGELDPRYRVELPRGGR